MTVAVDATCANLAVQIPAPDALIRLLRPMSCSFHSVLGAFLIATLCVFCPFRACGQDGAHEESPTRVAPDPGPWVPSLRTMGQDALDIASAPFELSPSQQLLTLGAVGLVASTAAAVDNPAYQYTSVRSGPISRVTAPFAGPGRWYDRVGPDHMALGTAGLLAASGVVLQRRAFTRTSVRVVEALVYTKVVTGLAKSVINRSRPFAAPGALTADPGSFSSKHSKLSMPSGHTARAFAVASVLSHQANRWYVSVPAYGMAASVGLERVRSGDHWLTDVMIGGALGYFIGRTVAAPSSDPGVSYTPVLGTDRVGLTVHF